MMRQVDLLSSSSFQTVVRLLYGKQKAELSVSASISAGRSEQSRPEQRGARRVALTAYLFRLAPRERAV